MKVRASFGLLCLALGLVMAASAFAADPCSGSPTLFGPADVLVSANNGTKTLSVTCVGTDATARVTHVIIFSAPLDDAALSIVQYGPFGFYMGSEHDAVLYLWSGSTYFRSGRRPIQFAGGHPYQSGNGVGANGGVCPEVVEASGFPFCDKHGILFEPAITFARQLDFADGKSFFPISELAAYGPGPYISALANAGQLYVLTPNAGGPNTGKLLGLTIDDWGNLAAEQVLWINVDVPADGVSRLAVGKQGIYFQPDSQNIFLAGFHTVLPYAPIAGGYGAGNAFGPIAVLAPSAHPF